MGGVNPLGDDLHLPLEKILPDGL